MSFGKFWEPGPSFNTSKTDWYEIDIIAGCPLHGVRMFYGGTSSCYSSQWLPPIYQRFDPHHRARHQHHRGPIFCLSIPHLLLVPSKNHHPIPTKSISCKLVVTFFFRICIYWWHNKKCFWSPFLLHFANFKTPKLPFFSEKKTLTKNTMFFDFPRMAELLRWVKEDLREDESLLLFGHQSRVQQIAGAADRMPHGSWAVLTMGSRGYYKCDIFNPPQEIRNLQNAMANLAETDTWFLRSFCITTSRSCVETL